ncbi:hypothetical protein FACHB389_29300 [Nostoc calcicola FACHB-389]|nr:hypothetical protein [Nostoc calcicola FACHB-3891]MDZ8057452.1 hypothetical protein [Nostoc sp. EkiNYC01]OKH25705.1 hypothetical protein FACHB389_29300 [Nostoc calcicola FACHB-389]
MSLLPLTLAQLFGDGSSQDSQYLILQKADLPLTANLNNSAEQVLAAICLKALESMQGSITDEASDIISDENGSALIEYDESDLYELLRIFRWKSYYVSRDSAYYERKQIIIQYFS